MKIALTIPTGRPNVKKVINAFLNNAKLWGFNLKDFSVYLSIDSEFQNTKRKNFILDTNTEQQVNKVEYITKAQRKILGEEVVHNTKIEPIIAKRLFMGNGYSKQRNSALFLAAQDGNDIAICFDDDEAPFVPVKKNDNSLIWRNLDFFGPHIKELTSGADITRGPILGYLSPIPSDFEKDIPEEIRKKLGEALQWGSDVITRHSFFDLMNKIKYLPESELSNSPRPFSVQDSNNGKHIYAGNMGFNLHSVRSGKIPIFYTPPKARGEDTIFALQLNNCEVREVNSFIFHDPFDMYPNILNGDFPQLLRPVPVTQATKERFSSALLGWIKYAPILIHLTAKNQKEKSQRIKEMLHKIDDPTQELAELLNCPELKSCKGTLDTYQKRVAMHARKLVETQTIWKNNIVPTCLTPQIPVFSH